MKVPLTELPSLVEGVLQSLDSARDKSHAVLIALRGDLGAGKTTFVQRLAQELGITETVASPTYVLMKKYKTTNPKFQTLVHIDAYRLEDPKEFAALRPEGFLGDPGCVVVVEWPEKLGRTLPAPDLTLNFSSQDAGEGERYIEMV